MINRNKYTLLFMLLFVMANVSFSQLPSHNMATAIVSDCRANFYDDGGPNGNYASLSAGSSTFQIITNNPIITMTFNPLSTKTLIQINDYITFYNQLPLIPANIIAGPYTNVPVTGTISNVVSTTGSLIVVFSQDGTAAGAGWEAGWFSIPTPPISPAISISGTPSCNINQLILNTTEGVACDSLKPNYFVVNGPMFPGVASVSPVPSACNNGTTNVIQINFSQPINQNCTYNLNSTLFRYDACDSVYKFSNITTNFLIPNCPIQASLNVLPTNTVCISACSASVSAVSPATVCLNLSYNWDNGLPPTAGPHAVCPTVTTVYNCTITETSSLTQKIITQTVYVQDPYILPLASSTVCLSLGGIQLNASQPGGIWTGPGITDSLTGNFVTWWAGAGTTWVKYQLGSCSYSIPITIIDINSGNNESACLGAPNFTFWSSPAGGTWYGDPNVSPNGIFTPTAIGTYTVLYTTGTCTSAVKTINVVNSVSAVPNTFTICQSAPNVDYSAFVNTIGGEFTGAGITNWYWGTYSPSIVPSGPHVITYSINGCATTFTVNVLEIDVSPTSSVVCPGQPPFVLSVTATPVGGLWSCPATPGSIQNASTGLYDPGFSSTNTHTDILIYTANNGCAEAFTVIPVVTTVVKDSVFFCDNNDSLRLSGNWANFNYYPSNGIYTGPGVVFQNSNYYFKPSVAGQGIHTVYYDLNTCRDSVKMIVYPSQLPSYSPTLCSTFPPFTILPPLLPGAAWSGAGITTPSLGVYNPASVLPGITTVTYSNKAGCTNTININVYTFQPALITGLNSTYCFVDADINFSTSPLNGTLSAPSTISNNIFNPALVGAGTHSLTFEYGLGTCYTSTTVVVKIHPELINTFTITADTVCLGEASKLILNSSGGLPSVSQYTYSWSNGLLPLTTQVLVPNATTVYSVTVTDGCSDEAVSTITIVVSPQYYPSFVTSPIKCYGESAQATVNINPTGNYSYSWNTNPVQTSNVLNGFAGKNYTLKIKNLNTGCLKDTSLKLPGYSVIKAQFTPNPNLTCIPFNDNNVTFIDQSNGASSGNWNFNGTMVQYSPGEAVTHLFETPGNYNVTLTVKNDGDCESRYNVPICILESTDLFFPDIFSPNKDGANDILYVRGNGIEELSLILFDRWGSIIFESTDVKIGWDGTYKGKDCEVGIYAYTLEAKMFDNKKISKKGEITLIR